MTTTIVFNSFHRGCGTSTIAANVAAVLATKGKRVGVVDASIPAPTLHLLFGLPESDFKYTINHYLLGECELSQAAHDVSAALGPGDSARLFLAPASTTASLTAQVLRAGYDLEMLGAGFRQLAQDLALDILVIDTDAGLDEGTLSCMALADAFVIVLRLDKQHYQGIAVTVEVANRLELPFKTLVVNEAPSNFTSADVRQTLEQTYNCEVAGVLSYADELMVMGSAGLFVLRHPLHPVTATVREIASRLMPA